MLSLTFVNDKELILPFCKKFKKVYTPGFYLYTANAKGQQIACGIFEISGSQVEVIGFCTEDPEDYHLLDGILRAGFNYANENHISIGVIPEEFRNEFNGLFEKLNYGKQSVFNITNFFDKYKNCKL